MFVNHYGSTEIYTFSVRPDVHAQARLRGPPGAALGAARGRRASTERRVGPDEIVAAGEKGEIIASLDSDEAFAGYWNRPGRRRARRCATAGTSPATWATSTPTASCSWPGRVDDMIISGGENIHPVEVEEVLARHPAGARTSR